MKNLYAGAHRASYTQGQSRHWLVYTDDKQAVRHSSRVVMGTAGLAEVESFTGEDIF